MGMLKHCSNIFMPSRIPTNHLVKLFTTYFFLNCNKAIDCHTMLFAFKVLTFKVCTFVNTSLYHHLQEVRQLPRRQLLRRHPLMVYAPQEVIVITPTITTISWYFAADKWHEFLRLRYLCCRREKNKITSKNGKCEWTIKSNIESRTCH